MKKIIGPISDLITKDSPLLDFIFNGLYIPTEDKSAKINVINRLSGFIKDFRMDLTVIAESGYVDKCFRDAYYNYYSSKLLTTQRNCIRLSFFNPDIKDDFSNESLEKLNDSFLGFVVIRPIKKIIGRNVIDTNALERKGNAFNIMKAEIPTSCLGIKLSVKGFPHSSQDGEMMTCAETTIWGIMEYFGNKYPEYSPVLGSQIHKVLALMSFERQLPSSGLTFIQISRALKEEGFGSIIYSNHAVLQECLACYIESGIPVAICFENDKIHHAVIGVGHDKIDPNEISKAPTETFGTTTLYVWNKNISNFIFNDDNWNPYVSVPFDDPAKKYVDAKFSRWELAKITMICVPLNKKIYLDAYHAIWLSKKLAVEMLKVRNNSVIRTFIASSRTYKQYLMLHAGLNVKIKEVMWERNMPKFIWITEIGDVDSCKASLIEGLMILDATNPNADESNIIWAHYDKFYHFYNKNNRSYQKYSVPLLSKLKRFEKNLI